MSLPALVNKYWRENAKLDKKEDTDTINIQTWKFEQMKLSKRLNSFIIFWQTLKLKPTFCHCHCRQRNSFEFSPKWLYSISTSCRKRFLLQVIKQLDFRGHILTVIKTGNEFPSNLAPLRHIKGETWLEVGEFLLNSTLHFAKYLMGDEERKGGIIWGNICLSQSCQNISCCLWCTYSNVGQFWVFVSQFPWQPI